MVFQKFGVTNPSYRIRGYKPLLQVLFAAILMMFLGSVADAQLSDLDLLADDDRSFGASVTAMPDPATGAFAEARSAVLLLPLNIQRLHFEGGAGAYFTQSIVDGEVASALMWRVQGGPHWGKIGLQFYVEGLWKQGIDYAGFVRFGEFDLGRVILSGGLGTLVRADTQTDLAIGVERNAPGGGDVKVKGLILGSAEVDTELFESLRLLGTVLPGGEGEDTDFVSELQVAYSLGRINLGGTWSDRMGARGMVAAGILGLVQRCRFRIPLPVISYQWSSCIETLS